MGTPRWIGEKPLAPMKRWSQRILELLSLFFRECPRMEHSNQLLVGGIEAAPNKSEVAGLVVEKTLIGKTSVVRIWLIESVNGSARFAGNVHRAP